MGGACLGHISAVQGRVGWIFKRSGNAPALQTLCQGSRGQAEILIPNYSLKVKSHRPTSAICRFQPSSTWFLLIHFIWVNQNIIYKIYKLYVICISYKNKSLSWQKSDLIHSVSSGMRIPSPDCLSSPWTGFIFLSEFSKHGLQIKTPKEMFLRSTFFKSKDFAFWSLSISNRI